MKKARSLFSDAHNAPCPAYRYVLDAVDERSRSVKAHCEDLWRDFSVYADRHFVDEFPVNFHQRWFEMYMTVSLVRAGLTVECPKPGPDVLLTLGGRRIWIEAVCATKGRAGKPDSVPHLENGKVQDVPVRQYVTRIRNSLEEKARKFRTYIEKGIVDRGDVTVIAVNSSQIPFLSADLDDCMMRSLYGVGNRIVTLSRDTGRIINAERESIKTIAKTSGKAIGAQPFLDGSTQQGSFMAPGLVRCRGRGLASSVAQRRSWAR